MAETPVLQVEHLTMRYGEGCPHCKDHLEKNRCTVCGTVWAANDISLEVYPGEVLGIVGESGSGKSTLMQSLYFDLIPTEGKAYLQNYGEGKKNIWDASPLEKRKIRNNIMGMVYQNPVRGLRMDYSAASNIAEKIIAAGSRNAGQMTARAEELLEAVEEISGGKVILTIRRGDEIMDIKLDPVEYAPDEYRLGIWVRDNVQGLGTVTFLTDQSRFGALGHGIHDTDTSVLMSISDGTVYRTSIQDIIRGTDGSPGSMEGIIVYNNYNVLGKIDKNTEAGIYGSIDKIDELFEDQIPIEAARKEEIVTGPATIRCFIDNELKEYEIQVTDIDVSGAEINKGLVIRVTDPELLEKTGGIIQGMSGSPIIQNGKLIGAVTHVFVQDSTMGYGIFIENMLNQVE